MHLVKGLKAVHKSHSEYESVEDNKDLRIPIQNEDAFKHGIIFKAKYIGTQEITKPSSRVEIVSSMRRIRYEYKYRNIKKRRVHLEISVNGIKVTLWKKKKLLKDGRFEESQLFVMCYPINRVFYVSHDSQDLLIFSYIARGDDGLFRCSVFKAFRKAQAMSIVRTIGQAFEVCHKLNLAKNDVQEKVIDQSQRSAEENEAENPDDQPEDTGETDIDNATLPLRDDIPRLETVVTDLDEVARPASQNTFKISTDVANGTVGSQRISSTKFLQIQQVFQQQLNYQIQEAEAAKAETDMLKEQLRIESESRLNAQGRVQHLLAQNRELLVTIQKMVMQLQNTQGRGLFDPVDESWMTTSLPVNDSFFPSLSEPVASVKTTITKECLSSIYDNQHHQSLDLTAKTFSSELSQPTNHMQLHPPAGMSESFTDLCKNRSGELTKEALPDNISEPMLSGGVKEGQGGISTSFTDLRQVGVGDNKTDWNHNKGHITKFSANSEFFNESSSKVKEATKMTNYVENETLTEGANSIFSKEMMETFSEEICEMEGSTLKEKST